MEIYSKYYNSQTVRARELKFGVNVHLPKCVTSHVSHVMCHMSHVTCNIFFGQKGGASQWRVCYQWGLPRLVLPMPDFLINPPPAHQLFYVPWALPAMSESFRDSAAVPVVVHFFNV